MQAQVARPQCQPGQGVPAAVLPSAPPQPQPRLHPAAEAGVQQPTPQEAGCLRSRGQEAGVCQSPAPAPSSRLHPARSHQVKVGSHRGKNSWQIFPFWSSNGLLSCVKTRCDALNDPFIIPTLAALCAWEHRLIEQISQWFLLCLYATLSSQFR